MAFRLDSKHRVVSFCEILLPLGEILLKKHKPSLRGLDVFGHVSFGMI